MLELLLEPHKLELLLEPHKLELLLEPHMLELLLEPHMLELLPELHKLEPERVVGDMMEPEQAHCIELEEEEVVERTVGVERLLEVDVGAGSHWGAGGGSLSSCSAPAPRT